MIRISKYISQSGYCSRRDAERLILEGKVKVNSQILNEVVYFVKEGDVVEANGQIVKITENNVKLWVYYKKRGCVTTHNDPEKRNTVFNDIAEEYPNLPYLISVGRLDLNSEGLLLLTNSGKVSRYLELPDNNFSRKYLVKAYGRFSEKDLKKISSGIEIDGIFYKKNTIKLLRSNQTNSWFEISLTEGKNREIRKLFEHINLKVNRLIRTEYGPFLLDKMKPGEILEVTNNNKFLNILEKIESVQEA